MKLYSVTVTLDTEKIVTNVVIVNVVVFWPLTQQGGIGGVEGEVSLTAFITLALNHSLPFLTDAEKKEAVRG